MSYLISKRNSVFPVKMKVVAVLIGKLNLVTLLNIFSLKNKGS